MAPAASKRIKNISICRPIIYGNSAVPLLDSERTENTPVDHTHKWTIFVRDPNDKDEDLGYIIKKVVFKLHDTYPQPLRSIESHPFEVTETGWGEFEISIRIFFVSQASEKNILVYHHLKLHPYNPTTGLPLPGPTGATIEHPVESFIYDELVFNEPTEAMFEILTSRPGALLPGKNSQDRKYTQETENEELHRYGDAMEKVEQQIKKARQEIAELEKEKEKLQV